MLQNKLSAAIVPANRPSTRLHKIQLLPLAITAARLPIYIYLYIYLYCAWVGGIVLIEIAFRQLERQLRTHFMQLLELPKGQPARQPASLR